MNDGGATSAFFRRRGDDVEPTEHAASPWNPATQAGGAAAALLVQLIEQRARDDLRPVRANVDILGPVPMTRAQTSVRCVRRGRATELFEAALSVGGAERVKVGVWRVAPAPALPDRSLRAPPEDPLTPPEDLPDHTPPVELFGSTGYVPAMQWRLAYGGFDTPGPGAAWSRPRFPLLAGTSVVPMSRLLLAGATVNGLSGVLDPEQFLAIDVAYSVHLARDPAGTWLGVAADTHVATGRAGYVTCTFHDGHGPLGCGNQALLVTNREPEAR